LSCLIRIVTTRCHFGGVRRWFVCPGGCGRKVGILYLGPGGSSFVCRSCADLTYESSQRHDKRADLLARLSHQEFLEAFPTKDLNGQIRWFREAHARLEELDKIVSLAEPPAVRSWGKPSGKAKRPGC
jgi:hypothetical protein